jgi:Fe-Mn family superoxide dismutase
MAEEKARYSLPPLRYGYDALAPVISEELLRLHHDKHHAAYVNGANAVFTKLEKARAENADVDMKAIAKEFSFHFGGNLLHTKFWENMAPSGKAGGKPGGKIGDEINKEFGSFDRFKKEFTVAANSAEGSGWAAVGFCTQTRRPIIVQIEKHNVNVLPAVKILLVLDVWEHAYYLDYKNDRGKFVENWWNIVNWEEVDKRLQKVLGSP